MLRHDDFDRRSAFQRFKGNICFSLILIEIERERQEREKERGREKDFQVNRYILLCLILSIFLISGVRKT